MSDLRFVTELGCTIRVVPAPDHLDQRGALLVLQMEQVGDGRRVSAYLNPGNIEELETMLHRWRVELADQWLQRDLRQPEQEQGQR